MEALFYISFQLVVSDFIYTMLLGVLCLGMLKEEEINLKDNILIAIPKSNFTAKSLQGVLLHVHKKKENVLEEIFVAGWCEK